MSDHGKGDCGHVAIQDDMNMICTNCGIVLSVLERPKEDRLATSCGFCGTYNEHTRACEQHHYEQYGGQQV